jgi:hypothetical protein
MRVPPSPAFLLLGGALVWSGRRCREWNEYSAEALG